VVVTFIGVNGVLFYIIFYRCSLFLPAKWRQKASTCALKTTTMRNGSEFAVFWVSGLGSSKGVMAMAMSREVEVSDCGHW